MSKSDSHLSRMRADANAPWHHTIDEGKGTGSIRLSMKCTLAWPSILGLLLTGYAQAGAVELSVDITPRHWRVNVPGQLLFQIKAVDGQLETGGRISVALPGSWTLHALHLVKLEWRDVDLRNRVLRVRESKSGKQRTIPIDDTLYSTLRDLQSRFEKAPVFPEPDGKLVPVTRVPTEELAQQFRILPPEEEERWKIELVEEHFDGTYHRFDRRVILTLLSGELSSGRTVTLEYGTATRPIHSSRLVETISFPISIDDGDGRWRPLQSSPKVTTESDPLWKILVTLPSQAKLEQPVEVHAGGRDRLGNPAPLLAGLELRSSDSSVEGHALPASPGEVWQSTVRFKTPGFQTVQVGNDKIGFYRSNPILVTEREPELKLFWGDLHSHSALSKDAIGLDAFGFARDHADLDFFASSEHSTGDRNDPGITDREWQLIQDRVRSFYEPGRFVTLLAYECSLPAPYAHHNVYFDSDQAPIYRKHEVKTLEELWHRLSSHRAFTVPHHTGVHWAAARWEKDHPLRPLFEIFSVHGQSELYDPQHPLSYDRLTGIPPYWTYPIGSPSVPEAHRGMIPISSSAAGPHYARDAWAADLRMGTIAASDDHTARPGQPYWGLAAVWAERLDRESVFAGLLERRTYATTGQRIYLDFRVNGRLPGEVVVCDKPPRIEVEACGTDDLDWVEITAFDSSTRQYEVLRRWTPGDPYLRERMVDQDFSDHAFYYVRLRQRGLVDERVVMAWSSPIWIETTN